MSRQKTRGAVWILVVLFLVMTTSLNAGQRAIVRVTAPQSVSGDFDIRLDIDNAVNLDAGQFDLVFDPHAIQILEVNKGAIGDTVLPVDLWSLLNPGRIRVLVNFPGVRGISGSGWLASIRARAIGKTGRPAELAIQKGLLVDQEAQSSPAQWIDGKTNIEGIAEQAGPVSAAKAGETTETGRDASGMTISTPMAMAGLAALALLPALLLFFFRHRKPRP